MTIINKLIKVDQKEMLGPFECPYCHGIMSFAKASIEKERTHPICPYCYLVVKVPPYEIKEE